jgi:hypothetical protein
MVSVDEPEPGTVAGLNVAVAPEGRALTEKLTGPMNPLSALVLTEYVVDEPAYSDCDCGLTLTVKSGVAFTTTVAFTEWLRVPLVPVIVSGYVPAGPLAAVAILNVDEPEPVTDAGVNVGVAPAGSPLTAKLTVPVNALSALVLIVKPIDEPAYTVCDCGLTVRVKSGAALTAIVAVIEWTRLPLLPVIVSGYVPAAVLAPVAIANDDEPEPVTDAGLKIAVAPEGNPLTARLIAPVNPFNALVLTA